jgi:ribosome-binding factor A
MNLGTARIVRKTLMEAFIIAQERIGGFFDFDKWQIKLLTSIGIDRGETIRYGKNLQGIRVYENWSNVCTKILPVGPNGIILPEVYMTADIEYSEVYAKVINFDIQPEEGQELTEEDIIAELRILAQEYLDKYKYPEIHYEIQADVDQTLDIGDTVYTVTRQIEVPTTVQGYVYDVNKKRVTKLIYGNFNRDVKRLFSTLKSDVDQALAASAGANKLIADQSNIINQLGKLGHVYQDDNEIMVLDALPKEDAQNVLRINLGGIGFSSNGIEGPFTTAWTLDGSFNASFITTGILNASLIKAGLLKGGKVNFNLDDGTFLIGDDTENYAIFFDGSTLSIKLGTGETIEEALDTKAEQSTVDELVGSVSDLESITVSNEELISLTNNINAYVELLDQQQIDVDQAKNDIVNLLGTSAAISAELGEYVQRWSFIDTYMIAGDDGFYIGEKNGSTGIRISTDRIDFLDGNGDPVAYITNQVMRINRGIFVDSAQIGEHKIETIDGGITVFTWV